MLEMARVLVRAWAAVSSSAAVSCKSEHEARSEKRPSLICCFRIVALLRPLPLPLRCSGGVYPGYCRRPPGGLLISLAAQCEQCFGAIVGGFSCLGGPAQYALSYVLGGAAGCLLYSVD